MEQIIKKAIEGGWKYQGHYIFDSFQGSQTMFSDYNFDPQIRLLTHEQIVLDPLFWQALGKACEEWCDIKLNSDGTCGTCDFRHDGESTWLGHAVTFHEINLTEGWDKAVEFLQEVTK